MLAQLNTADYSWHLVRPGSHHFRNVPEMAFLHLHEFRLGIRSVFPLQNAIIPVILIRENATYAS